MAFPVYRLITALLIFIGCHGNKISDGGFYMNDVLHIMSDQSTGYDENASSIQNVSDVCQQDLTNLFSGDPSLVQVIDSFGKLPSGLLYYNVDWVGNFDECMEINNFRHCLVDMELNVTITQNSSLVFPVSWGMCAPVSCSKEDVLNSAEFFLDSLNVTWFGVRDDSTVHCTEKRIFNGGFIGTCILLGIISLLTLVATALDHYITCQERASRGQRSSYYNQGCDQMSEVVKEGEKKHGQSSENGPIKGTTNAVDPNSGHIAKDGIGDRSVEEKSHLLPRVEEYRTTDHRGCSNFNTKAGESEIPITSEAASETTALLDTSCHTSLGESYHVVTVIHQNKIKDNPWIQLLLCFSMYRNLPMILNSQHAVGSITCLHGIRVLSMIWIICFHFINMILPAGLGANMFRFLEKNNGDFAAQILANAFAVDSFFLLGGLLLSYLTLKKMKDKNGKVGWGWLYLHRYIRLTPVLAVVILLHTFILPYMMRGPISHRYEFRVEFCKAWWWTDLLYINNLVPPGIFQDCIFWAWYLANDMQFFILSPLFLIPIYRYGVKGTIVLMITCLASFITIAVLAFQNNFHASPVAEGAGESLEPLLTGNIGYILPTDKAGVIYNKPYCRIPPYLLGIALGYVMHKIGNKKMKLSPVIVAIGWSCATALGITIVYGLYDVNRGAAVLSQAADILYITFSRFGWALAVSWIIFACQYGYGGFVNVFLSWNFWVPLGRLTYATYLMHPLVMFVFAYNMAAPLHWSIITMIYFNASFILISYCCALLMCVLVEFPFGNMEKLLQKFVQGKK